MIARETLDRIDTLLAEATPGPWAISDDYENAGEGWHVWDSEALPATAIAHDIFHRPNAALIVALANNAEGLVAAACEAADLQAENERLQAVERDWRQVLKAWGLGETDKMQAHLLALFLREFGRAPELDSDALAAARGQAATGDTT